MVPRWNDDRLDERFKALDTHVKDLRDEIRVFAPHSLQIGVLEHKVDAIERDIAGLERDIAALEQSVRTTDTAFTDLLRSGRADTVRLMLVIIVPLIAMILGGFATGMLK